MSEFLPGHARDHDGMLTIGNVRADHLAQEYGTPLLALDLGVIDDTIRDIRAACEPHGVRISYAAKALLVTALARRLATAGLGIDVCSLGELVTLERAQFPTARITFHGAGKTDAELGAALEGRVGRIVIDNLAELRRIARLPVPAAPLDTLLRINTGIEAHTHDFVRTAGDGSKFGFAPHEESAAIELLRALPFLRLRGMHAHIGSQIFEAEPFAANAARLVATMRRFADAGFDLDTLIAGGGFGIPMHPGAADESLDLRFTVAGMVARARAAVAAEGLKMPSLEIEPGRAIVGNAGTSIYRVLAIKRFSQRTFVVVDGSLADNPRPALYNAFHHVIAAGESGAQTQEVTICGRSCENDEMATAQLPRELQEGALLAVCSAGAYTYSMASNYNRFPRPPIVAVGAGPPHLYARREALEDLYRNDADA